MSEPSPKAGAVKRFLRELSATITLSTVKREGPLALAAAFAVTFALIWIRAAFQMAGHGFDTTDEAGYLLAYRWWDVNPRTYTGNQYIYGPIFQLLGYSIAKLRLFRFFTIIATHVVFGAAFMRWLRLRRPKAPKSPLWDLAGIAAIVAASGMSCSWLPLSPGYNDVSLLGAVLAAAFVLRLAVHVEEGTNIPRWLPAAFGPVILIVALGKWASCVTALFPALVVAAFVLVPRGWREVARVFAWVLAGVLALFVLVNVFIVRLDKVLPEMLEVNRLLAKHTNSPKELLLMYWDSTLALLKQAFERHELLIVAAGIAAVGRARETQAATFVLGAAGVYRSLGRIEDDRGLAGGTVNLARYSVTIHAIALAAFAMAVSAVLFGLFSKKPRPSLSRESLRGWMILGLLVILPITHGLGTGNFLYVMIVNGFAAWMALIIAIGTGLDTSPRVARVFGHVIAAGAIVASVLIAKSGLVEYPYRTESLAVTTAYAPGVPALRSTKLSPYVASRFGQLHRVLAPYVEPKGRAMMGYDEIAGYIYALDGRPIGESWTSAGDYARTAENLRASCRGGQPWWASRWPILIFVRAVTETEIRSLRDCGIDFATEYRLVAPPSETIGLTIYVPVRE